MFFVILSMHFDCILSENLTLNPLLSCYLNAEAHLQSIYIHISTGGRKFYLTGTKQAEKQTDYIFTQWVHSATTALYRDIMKLKNLCNF